MWIEQRDDHYRMYDRYTDPVTLKKRKVSVKMKKNTPQERSKAQTKLDELILKRRSYHADLSFKALCNVYIASKRKDIKASTTRRNTRECKILQKILGDVIVERLNHRYVKNKIVKWNPKPSTVNEHIQRFKEIIKWGYENDLVEDISFLTKITKIKDKSERQKVKDKYLEADECRILLDAMTPNWRYLTEFMIQSGMRIGECLALEVDDIDFETRKITVNKRRDCNVYEDVDTPKTDASIREVFMQDDLYDLCKEIVEYSQKLREVNEVNTLFFNDKNAPANYYAFNKYLGETSERVLGHRATTHTLRHTHASLLAEQENLPDDERIFEMIQKRLGHENSRITKEIYIHITKNREKQFEDMTKEVHLIQSAPKLPPKEE